MKKWGRRIRGAIGMGLAWAGAGFGAGILLARVPRTEVEDLVQDIFLHAFRKLATLRDANAFGGWLAMITRNRAMDFHRYSRATVEVKEEHATGDRRKRVRAASKPARY